MPIRLWPSARFARGQMLEPAPTVDPIDKRHFIRQKPKVKSLLRNGAIIAVRSQMVADRRGCGCVFGVFLGRAVHNSRSLPKLAAEVMDSE